MTWRAAILGFVAAALLGGLGYINDQILDLNRIVANHFPVSVFGTLILLVAVGAVYYAATGLTPIGYSNFPA